MWHFEPGFIVVGDFDDEVGEGVGEEDYFEVFDDGTGGFEVVVILTGVGEGEGN